MTLDLAELARLLDIYDPDISAFRDQIVQKFNDPVEIGSLLGQLCKSTGKQECQTCKSEGECSVVHGLAYLSLRKTENAIRNLEYASRYFSRKDETWNSILSMTILGLAFQQNGNMRQAIRQAQAALLRLDRNYLRLHAKEYPQKAINLQKDLQEFLKGLTAPQPKKRVFQRAMLAFSSLPIFSSVKAGPNGPIWDYLPKNPKTIVDRILLEDRLHALYSLSNGSQISLNFSKNYGFARADGDSMNASKPVNICDKDHVLFFESSDADNGEIVIASIPDDTGSGYKHTVKRYSKVDGYLVSETDPPGLYPPILLDKDTKIIGTVIAVAKPVDE